MGRTPMRVLAVGDLPSDMAARLSGGRAVEARTLGEALSVWRRCPADLVVISAEQMEALAGLAARHGPVPLRFADLTLDPNLRRARRGGRLVKLSPTEYRLLELFVARAGETLSHSEIFNAVWGCDLYRTSNTLAVYIGYLRRKLEADGEPRLIHTLPGFGYTMANPGEIE